MTRGRIVVILNGEVMLVSTEFNGDMYYEGHGEDIINAFAEIEDEDQYREFVKQFNDDNFEYNERLVYKISNEIYERYLNMSVGYFDNWFSDYIYVKNLSDETVEFITNKEYKYILKPNKIGVFYFGDVVDDIEENELELNMTDIEAYIQSLVNDDNVELYDMLNKCFNLEDVYIDNIYCKETLIDIMYEHAKNGDTFYAMAKDIDDNSYYDFFLFDPSFWGGGCTPIENKKELAQVLLEGSL